MPRKKPTPLPPHKLRATLAPERVPWTDSREIPERNGHALSQPREDLLLDNVKDLRWRFHRDDGSSSDRWPPEAALPGEMPLAVVMELELEDMGTLRRLLPLR